jgi:ABC-2 type transport system permease protein
MLFIADITGIMLGALLSATLKKSEGFKVGIMIGITLFCSFLSGLMSTEIKYFVTKSAPIVQYVNPVNLVADGLYALYYYGVGERYFLNLIILSVMTAVFMLLNFFILRRQKYASI